MISFKFFPSIYLSITPFPTLSTPLFSRPTSPPLRYIILVPYLTLRSFCSFEEVCTPLQIDVFCIHKQLFAGKRSPWSNRTDWRVPWRIFQNDFHRHCYENMPNAVCSVDRSVPSCLHLLCEALCLTGFFLCDSQTFKLWKFEYFYEY